MLEKVLYGKWFSHSNRQRFGVIVPGEVAVAHSLVEDHLHSNFAQTW